MDLSRWPRPPERGGEIWDTYWEYRTTEIVSTVGMLIRKLIEVDKVSVEVQGTRLEVERAPLRGDRVPTKINFPHVDRFYDLENPRSMQISIAEICNGLIHSFVLVPEFSYSSMTGLLLDRLFVASDRGRQRGVYIFRWNWFVGEFVGAYALMMSVPSLVNICLMVTACTYQAAMAARLSMNWQDCIAGSQKTVGKGTTSSWRSLSKCMVVIRGGRRK
jgi:hypothetical protein